MVESIDIMSSAMAMIAKTVFRRTGGASARVVLDMSGFTPSLA
jgi:hypothetical protein